MELPRLSLPSRRTVAWLSLSCAILALLVSAWVAYEWLTRPVLTGIDPAIAQPGDAITLRGKGFGEVQRDSRISLGGSHPTASSYLQWSDGLIRLRVPQTAESGLIWVEARGRRSNSLLFSNASSLPQPAGSATSAGSPSLSSASASSAAIGSELVLSGLNFGVNQEAGQVLFAAALESDATGSATPVDAGFLSSPSADQAYSLWSDNEIRVRVPDGAASGTFFVKTARGVSNALYLELSRPCGSKIYRTRKTYVIRYSVDISHMRASGSNDLYLWVPRPLGTSSQRSVRTVTMSLKPTMENYRESILYHFKDLRDGQSLQTSMDFILDSYEVETQAKPDAVRAADPSSPLAQSFLRPEPEVPSDTAVVTETAAKIVGREQNPWRKARLIYDWITDGHLSFRPELRESTARSLLASGSGDAYAAAMLFASLCRASGVPAAPCAGVRVSANQATSPHWWAEFWIDGLGWVPVDPAMGSGMDLGSDKPAGERRSYYFGNLDNSRIIFSRGFTAMTRLSPGSRVKPAQRFYALQGITEEAAGPISSYTSFWSDIAIIGIY